MLACCPQRTRPAADFLLTRALAACQDSQPAVLRPWRTHVATVDWHITRHRSDGRSEDEADPVVVELPLEIVVNGSPLVALMRLPGMDKELAVGFCLTEKVIESVEQITLLHGCKKLEEADARGEGPGELGGAGRDPIDAGSVILMQVEQPKGEKRFAGAYVVRTGCGGADLSAVAEFNEEPLTSHLRVEARVVRRLARALSSRQKIHPVTRGTHAAGIVTPDGRVIAVAEDVGRHNALDKAVGWCALEGTPLKDNILVITGRVSYEMALKATRVKIPVLVSMAAPTLLGLRLAEKAGLTVVGFAGRQHFNVYTHKERVVG